MLAKSMSTAATQTCSNVMLDVCSLFSIVFSFWLQTNLINNSCLTRLWSFLLIGQYNTAANTKECNFARWMNQLFHIIKAWSSHIWHSVLRLCTRLSCRPNSNIWNPHIGRKIVRYIKWCGVILFPTISIEISDRSLSQ